MNNNRGQGMKKNTYLRRHQQEIYNFSKKHKNMLCTATCGAGKTRVEFSIMSDFLKKESGVVVFIAPRHILIEQQLDEFLEHAKKNEGNVFKGLFDKKGNRNFNIMEVSSRHSNDVDVSTTKIDDIIKNIKAAKKTNRSMLITVCNKSVPRLYEACEVLDFNFDAVIADEAHYNTNEVKENHNA